MSEIRPASAVDAMRVRRALDLLREARDLLAGAGAVRAAERTRDAIKSAEGAARHVDHRVSRTDEHGKPFSYVSAIERRSRS